MFLSQLSHSTARAPSLHHHHQCVRGICFGITMRFVCTHNFIECQCRRTMWVVLFIFSSYSMYVPCTIASATLSNDNVAILRLNITLRRRTVAYKHIYIYYTYMVSTNLQNWLNFLCTHPRINLCLAKT